MQAVPPAEHRVLFVRRITTCEIFQGLHIRKTFYRFHILSQADLPVFQLRGNNLGRPCTCQTNLPLTQFWELHRVPACVTLPRHPNGEPVQQYLADRERIEQQIEQGRMPRPNQVLQQLDR
jgi:hypothetical protein